jgi:hypothetical protein
VVDCIGINGGLALLWDLETTIEIQNFSQHHINAVIKAPTNELPWKLAGNLRTPGTSQKTLNMEFTTNSSTIGSLVVGLH